MRSPIDTMKLILEENLPCDNYDLVEEWVGLIAKTCLQFRRELDPLLTDRFNDAIFFLWDLLRRKSADYGGRIARIVFAPNGRAVCGSTQYVYFKNV